MVAPWQTSNLRAFAEIYEHIAEECSSKAEAAEFRGLARDCVQQADYYDQLASEEGGPVKD
jgi:hypothetical protein